MPFIGIAAGALLPMPKISDVNGTGVHVLVPIGIMSPSGRAGLRVDLGYGRLPGKEDVRRGAGQTVPAFGGEGQPFGSTGTFDAPPLGIWSVGLNGILRRPFGAADEAGVPRSGIYIFGGGGVSHLRSYILDAREQNLTRPFWNGGLGLDFGAGTRSKFFVEASFKQVLTPSWQTGAPLKNVNVIPITVGLRF
jgi:hypothetical protein